MGWAPVKVLYKYPSLTLLPTAVLSYVHNQVGSSEEEIDKEALQNSYKTHLERLGLIAGKVKTDRDKNPEFDRQKGDFKRQSYGTTRLGRLLLRMIDCAADETGLRRKSNAAGVSNLARLITSLS